MNVVDIVQQVFLIWKTRCVRNVVEALLTIHVLERIDGNSCDKNFFREHIHRSKRRN